MNQYIITKLEENTATEAWGPFPTADAATEWLGRYDGRLLDFIWEKKGDDLFAVVADGDIGLSYYQVRRLDAPVE